MFLFSGGLGLCFGFGVLVDVGCFDFACLREFLLA